jgi:hypothetical protein
LFIVQLTSIQVHIQGEDSTHVQLQYWNDGVSEWVGYYALGFDASAVCSQENDNFSTSKN